MATTFTWTIQYMKCEPTEGAYTDVVIVAGWNCLGTDGTYGSSVYGACSFPAPSGTFTPYDQLTQDQVLGWCWANGVNKTETEASVQAQVTSQSNNPVVTPPLPWST